MVSGERGDAGRAEEVRGRALRGVERQLGGQPARKNGPVGLEPPMQMPAAVAELTQLLGRLGRLPPVLVSPIGSLGRIRPRLPPAPRCQRPWPAPTPKDQFGLAL